ncbi:hypothetical protein BY996DRAFT_4576377 [Phakopsora pachyrhizi]|nr:hypothetical protein BY996DRAFT_4576377 [Phakopsora pachyrhizi]
MTTRLDDKRIPIRIKGFVTSMEDVDNFRLYQTPGFGWNWLQKTLEKMSDLKGKMVHIRLAGFDAPEVTCAHW